MSKRLAAFKALLMLCCLMASAPTQAQDESNFSWSKAFKNLWSTPEQQAQRAWENGDNERLNEVAPNASWQGAAAYREGDYETAKEAFSGEIDAAAVEPSEAARSVFNSATTDIQLGDYASAIQLLDTLLDEQPDHADAARNRAIAERLLELEQQPQEGEGEGESSEDSESSDSENSENSDDQGESGDSSEQEQQENSDGSESEESESQEQNESSGDPSDSQNGEQGDDASGSEQSDDEIEAARQALQAAGEESQDEPEGTEAEQIAAQESEEPLSEQDQASEQWLRQIPDDPDDLLRRKLLQNHRSEYPDVQVNGRGW